MAKRKEKILVDMEHIPRIFDKIWKVLQKKTKTPLEALIVLRSGVPFLKTD